MSIIASIMCSSSTSRGVANPDGFIPYISPAPGISSEGA